MQPGRQKNGDQALGRSRGGLSTKIHALVEGLGSLARFSLTGGEAGDSPQALPRLKDLRPGSLSADKAYDSDAIIDHLNAEGIEAVIPPRSNRLVQRPFDEHLYKIVIWSSDLSAASSTSGVSPPVTTNWPLALLLSSH